MFGINERAWKKIKKEQANLFPLIYKRDLEWNYLIYYALDTVDGPEFIEAMQSYQDVSNLSERLKSDENCYKGGHEDWESDIELKLETISYIREIIRKEHGGGKRPNGGYLSTLKDGVVQLNTKLFPTTAVHLQPGIAYLDGKLYLPYLKTAFCRVGSEDIARNFIAATYMVDWASKDLSNLLKNKRAVKYLHQILADLEVGGTGKVNEEMEEWIELSLFGEKVQEKRVILKNTQEAINNMVGLGRFKEEINDIVAAQRSERKMNALGLSSKVNGYHALFLGPSGTGKTESARLYADLLFGLGAIKERKVREVSKEDLVGNYIGDTEKNTKAIIQEAMGGLLFVDEAYTLAQAGDNPDTSRHWGKTALEIIMRAMDNHRQDLVVVFAGYPEQMRKFIEVNEGMSSRVNREFHFDDFTHEELTEIYARLVLKNGFELHDANHQVKQLIKSKLRGGKLAGNARSVRKLVDRTIEEQKKLVSNGEVTNFRIITKETVMAVTGGINARDKDTLELMQQNALATLDSMIGMHELKEEVKTWTNMLKIQKIRRESNLTTGSPTLHMAFKGNPGTGKTSVARIIADLLKSNGLLSKGHYKEVSRAELVDGNPSTTIRELFKDIDGGVLFIDEAYTLVQGEEDHYGAEAVGALIAEMENRREDVAVIFAGYTEDIQRLLDTNAGFASRISNHYYFPDYLPLELFELLKLQLNTADYNMTKEAEDLMVNYIYKQVEMKQTHSNGRWVRNLADQLIKKQANRLAKSGEFDEKSLVLITKEDVKALQGF